MTGKMANTIGVAPRRPAQPSISRSGTLNPQATTSVASGRATTAVKMANAPPVRTTSPSRDGNTSSPSNRNSPSWATQATPSWKVTIVRRAGVETVPITSPAR